MKSIKTRLLAGLTAAVLLASAFAAAVPAYAEEPTPPAQEVKTEGDFQYVEKSDAVVTLVGYTGSETHLVIPEKLGEKRVTHINFATPNDQVTALTLNRQGGTMKCSPALMCSILRRN